MFHRIMIPVGLSERMELALDSVGQLAAAGAHVELFHVVERSSDIPDPELEPFYRTMQDRADKRLAEWASQLAAQGFETSADVRIGKTGPLILEHIREWGPDLVLVPSHAITGPDARLGTLSHQLAVFSPSPVLLLR